MRKNKNNRNNDFDIEDKDEHFETKIYLIISIVILIIPTILAIINLQIDWAIVLPYFIVILLPVSLLIIWVYRIITKKKYWNFNADSIFMTVYMVGFILMFGGIAAFPKYIPLIVILYIVALVLSFILSKVVNNLVYDKDKILTKVRFKTQNFIRPNRNTNVNNFIELANKYCIVRIDSNVNNFITYFDKVNHSGWKVYVGNKSEAIRKYEILAKLFTFETTAEDILVILKNINTKTSSKCISKVECEIFEIKSINNMSVAELICLPGINMGKAYKIHKYLQKHTFKNAENFIRFAQISQIEENDMEFYNSHKFD